MKYFIFLLFLLPLYCLGQSVPGCYNYVAQATITATSNSTISGFAINCNGAAIPGIAIPAGVHDVHITKCKIQNSTTSNGLINIGSGCYNITIDTCFFQSGYRGIYAVGATNNIHIWYNFFYNIIDPKVTATSTDGGGSSVQLNNCTGTSIQVLDNRSYHDISSSGVGDQFSLYKCSGTAASPIRICRNQALNGSTNPPSTGYAGAVAGDLGGGYQRVDSNIFVNTGAVGAQIQGGHDIEMSYNTIYLAQATYTSVAIAFGNYSGTSSSNITISYNSARCIQPNGNVFNFWFDPKTAFQPTGWSTNATSTGLNANILPNPLWSACALAVLPPNISYSQSFYTFTMGTAITAFTPSNSGGIASFTATLPTGLTINPSTGTISGTPTIGTPPTNYTVTAINTAGSSSTTINIGVLSSDAALKNMTLSSGTLSPIFCSCTGNYTAGVPNSVSSITLTPTVNQVNATVTVNGTLVTSDTPSGAINLVVGGNVIKIVVTAQNGSTNTYTVTVTRAASTDATLSSLAISSGSLSPAFASGTTSYTVNVNSSVASITLTPTTNQSNATVTVNGAAVVAGNASTAVNLAVGDNSITTVVTAQDGSTIQIYTVAITRPPAATIITLDVLTPAAYGDPPITLTAGSNNTDVGAAIVYSSDNPSVATVSGSTVTIFGAGAANITASEAASANFMAAQNVTQTLVVSKANLTITAHDQHKVYGSLFTFDGTEFTTEGLVTGDVVTSVTLLSNGAAALASTGTYPITPNAATGDGLSNYDISYVPGAFMVNGINLTFAAIPSQVYGAGDFDPGATSQSSISYTSSNTAVATIVNGNIHIVGVGTSTITATSVNVSQTQTLNVSPAQLTITSIDVNKTYGASLSGGYASNSFNVTGLQNGETVGNVIINFGPGADADASAGSYTGSVTPSGAAGGTFNANNYNITYTPGDVIVGKTILTITANNSTKVYGTKQAFAGTEFVASGLQNSDAINAVTLTSAGTPALAQANNYAIVASAPVPAQGTDLSNYTVQFVNGMDAVGQATLTITADNQNMFYGSQVPALTLSYSGFVNSEIPESLDQLPIATTTATAVSSVGGYPITVSGAADNNYTFNYVGGTLSVNAVPLTFNPLVSQIYGSGDFNPGATSGSPVTYASSNTSVATILAGIVHIKSVGTTLITANNGSSTASQMLTVTPADLTISADNLSKIQGHANPVLTISYSGLVNGDTKDNLTTQPSIITTATTSSPVGAYPITVSSAVDANYNISYLPGTLTVTGIALSFSPIPSKEYGTADFNPGATSSSAVTYTSSNTAAATIVSDNIHIVGVGTSTITANDGSTTLQQTLTVAPAALNITANNVTKTYGSTVPGGTGSTAFTAIGLANGQTIGSITVAYGAGSSATSNVGAYTGSVTLSAATGGTFTASNYTITYTTGNIIVSAAALSITASSVTKTYGVALTGGTGSTAFTSGGLVNGQTIGAVTIAFGTGSAANAAAGSYTGSVTPSSATGGTFTASNYAISYAAGTITVNKAALTITANNQTKTQGATNPTLTVSYSGFVNSETNSVLTTQPTVTTTAITSSPAGTYPITAGAAAAANYTIGYVPGTLTVTAAGGLTFNTIPFKVYGVANFSPGATTTTGTVTYTSGNTTVATIVSGNIHIVGAGTSTITASNGTTSLQQTLTVIKASLTITANNAAKTYGSTLTSGSGSSAFTSSGLVYSQTINRVTMTYSTGAAATAAIGTYTGTAIPSAATGGSFVAANYTITYVAGNIVVNKATLTITANNVTKGYGASITGFTGSTAFTSSGLKNGQAIGSVTIAYGTGSTAGSKAGSYSGSVTPSAATGGNFIAADYIINYISGNITVSRVSLTITANNQVKIQGNPNPSLTVSYSGFVNGETNSALTTQPTVTTTATTSSTVGTYPITASGAVDANYTITYVAGTLTVNPSTAALISVVNPLFETYVPAGEPSVRQAVSPNSDGINDVLHIDNIESYPDNKVTLMNRNGTTIFQITGYDNVNKVFDGHSNVTKERQKPGTYFYLLEYNVKGELKHKANFFVIKY